MPSGASFRDGRNFSHKVALLQLADYAARTWQRDFRSLNPTFRTLPIVLQTPDIAEQYRGRRAFSRKRAAQIRNAVRVRCFVEAFEAMAESLSVGDVHFRVLERAFPLRTHAERADLLQYVWCRSKARIPVRRALQLFRASPSLRKGVPSDWLDDVVVYRGARVPRGWRQPFERAKRAVRRGIAWTTDRGTAESFARVVIPGDVGCLGTAIVPRSAVLAYFHDPETIEIDGENFPVDGYRENECIIDPTTIKTIRYEAIRDREGAE